MLRGGYGLYHFPIPARTFNGMRGNPPLQGSYSFNWNDSANAPDALPNYFLRAAPTVIAGVNTANLPELSIAKPPVILPGVAMIALASDLPTSAAHQWNMTLEAEIMKDTVVRAGMVGTAGRNNESVQRYNANPISNYVWYKTSGLPLPTGFYSNTARRAIDQTTFGDISIYTKLGYSNYTGVQLELERRFSHGLAFQLFYLMSNSASTGNVASQGGGFATYQNDQPEIFLPGAVPQDPRTVCGSTAIRGIRIFRSTASAGTIFTICRSAAARSSRGNIGAEARPRGRRMADRRLRHHRRAATGRCRRLTGAPRATSRSTERSTRSRIAARAPASPAISTATATFRRTGSTTPTGVTGVPQSYMPAQSPINPIPASGVVADANFNDNNNVLVPLKNGQNQLVAYDTGLNPWRNQVMPGPWLTNLTASVYKSVPITERVNLRINLDAFNVLNQPGIGLPGADGIISLRTSAQGARTMQYGARMTW